MIGSGRMNAAVIRHQELMREAGLPQARISFGGRSNQRNLRDGKR